MEFGDWLCHSWGVLKPDGAQAGLRDDGWGDVAGTDWTVIARLSYLATMRERARCAEIVRLAGPEAGDMAEWNYATDKIIADINTGKFPPKPANFDGFWPSPED